MRGFAPIIVVITVMVVLIGGIFLARNNPSQLNKNVTTLKSIEECNNIISPIIDRNEPLQDALLDCKKKITAECDSKLAEVDNALNLEADWDNLVNLFEERKSIASACLLAWHEGPLDLLTNDKDRPLLGRGELGQANALRKLCDESINEIDTKLKTEKNYNERRNLYNQRQQIVNYCLYEWHSGDYSIDGLPQLGGDGYSETDVLVADCSEQIKAADDPIDIINDCKRKFKSDSFNKNKEPEWNLLIKAKNRTTDYTDGYFEFIDIATSQPSIAFSTTQKPHIIVAADEGKVDVRDWLPIKIEIKKDGSIFWTGRIEGNTAQICRGTTGCSTNGPSGIGIDWKKIEITAFDKNGKVVATFFETYNP